MQKLNNAKIKLQKIKDTTYLCEGPPPKLTRRQVVTLR
jgi:hypothetical protein